MSRRLLPTITALLLLTALRPAPAQTPALAPPSTYHWHSLVLQHAAPSDVLSRMHWDAPVFLPPFSVQPAPAGQTPTTSVLPEGVRRIFSLPNNNSLLVEAMPEGYAWVQHIVKTLDVAPRRVEINVEFVTAGIADVDNLGINFDLAPLPVPPAPAGGPGAETPRSFLAFATGNIVRQLYQALTRTRGRGVSVAPVTTPDGVAVTTSVDSRVPDARSNPPRWGALSTQLPRITHSLHVQGTLTLTPHVHPDGKVSLELLAPTSGKSIILRAVPSGDPLVFIAPPLEKPSEGWAAWRRDRSCHVGRRRGCFRPSRLAPVGGSESLLR